MSEISVDQQSYPLQELEDLQFNVNDYYGKRMKYPSGLSPGPSLSRELTILSVLNKKEKIFHYSFYYDLKENYRILDRSLLNFISKDRPSRKPIPEADLMV